MTLTFSGARTLVAIVAIAGVTGTAATTASAASTHSSHAKHAKRLHKTAGRPDLVAQGLNLDVSDTGFDVTASVANLGKSLAKSSDVVIALSDDTTLDDNDDVLDEYRLGSLGAGVTRSFDDSVDMPDDVNSDTEYLLVCADGNEEVTESNESNNCVSQEVDITDSSDDSSADDGTDDSGDTSGDDDSDGSGAVVLTGGQQQ